MRIAVVGGTGVLGSAVADALLEGGHEVRVLSRSSRDFPADVTTGAGLDRALEGCDAVVDASNARSPRAARRVLVEGGRTLLDAERRAGVPHHVCASIVGIDEFPFPYHRVKVEQEAVVTAGPVPWTIVRATQFHDLIASGFAAAARLGVVPAPRGVLQPVAVQDAARVIADVATGEPRRGRVSVTGPEIRPIRDYARAWRRARGSRALPVPMPVPPRMGRALRSGMLTDPASDHRGATTFESWLSVSR